MTRPSDITRERILKAAQRLFAAYNFRQRLGARRPCGRGIWDGERLHYANARGTR